MSPFATAGDDVPMEPTVEVQSGVHVFGVPEQFVTPAASNAYKMPEPT